MQYILFFFLLLTANATAETLIQPLEAVKGLDRDKVELGRVLFFDPELSRDGSVSCASCHQPANGWADKREVSIGVYGRKGRVNSPTVLNAVYNFKQFWNGRADSLKEQAKGPIHQNFEMDMNKELIEERVNKNEFYKKSFYSVYKTSTITFEQLIDAIVEYEKSLTTPGAKFDRYLKGELSLSQAEAEGYDLFRVYGCITCHNGVNVGGNSFQKMGIVMPYEDCYGDRYELTHRAFDRCVYKVPSLRNIDKTAPYFHDASAKTLQEAIKAMAYHNLGYEIDDKDVKKIEMFLKSLSADVAEKGEIND